MEGVNAVAANNWSIVDLVLLVGIGFSVIVGLWRGLVYEVMSLLGWVVSYTAAQWFGPWMAAYVPVGESGSRLNVIAGMLVAFVLAWLVWAMFSWLITKLLRESALNAPDRVLGAVFGLLRGLLVALTDRKSTRLNSSHSQQSRMPSSA